MRLQFDTPTGSAEVDLDVATNARALVLLGHGAGGSIDAPDLVAVRDVAVGAGVSVARVTQPYRVLGKRAPAPAARLDEAWLAVTTQLMLRPEVAGLPVVHGGRSSGARVACRCAAATGAAAVVALAFPVHPPGRPDRTRMDELLAVACPLLVVQGRSDAFGQPDPAVFDGAQRVLVSVAGTHALTSDTAGVAAAVGRFLSHFPARFSTGFPQRF